MPKQKDFSILKKSKAKKHSDKQYPTTVERLLTILSLLDKGKSVATVELAQDLGVTQRTVQRDIALLGRCKYPIWEKKPGRYAFVEGFSLRKVELTEEQASLMSFMGDIALSLGSKFESSFHDLFKRLMTKNMDTPFYAKLSVGEGQLPNTEIVKDLEKAIDCILSISFNDYSSQVVSYLMKEYVEHYRQPTIWEEMQLFVIESLKKHHESNRR